MDKKPSSQNEIHRSSASWISVFLVIGWIGWLSFRKRRVGSMGSMRSGQQIPSPPAAQNLGPQNAETPIQPSESVTRRPTPERVMAVAAAIAAFAAIISALATVRLTSLTGEYRDLTSKLVQLQVDPSLEMSVAEPFQPAAEVKLRNTGVEKITDIGVNLRCFVFRDSSDNSPAVEFSGYPSISQSHAWWKIPVLQPGTDVEKDGSADIQRFIHNGEILRRNERPSGTLHSSVFQSAQGLPLLSNYILVVDVVYHRPIDFKTYRVSRPVWLGKDSAGKAVLITIPVSREYGSFIKRLVGVE